MTSKPALKLDSPQLQTAARRLQQTLDDTLGQPVWVLVAPHPEYGPWVLIAAEYDSDHYRMVTCQTGLPSREEAYYRLNKIRPGGKYIHLDVTRWPRRSWTIPTQAPPTQAPRLK